MDQLWIVAGLLIVLPVSLSVTMPFLDRKIIFLIVLAAFTEGLVIWFFYSLIENT